MSKSEDKSRFNAVVTVEMIDAKKAQQYLADMFEEQRHMRENVVIRLATEMEQGNWRLSCDAILLIRGKLANGQHRLQAVLLCGKPMPFLVMRSNDVELYKVLDCGTMRTTWDALGDMPYAKPIAACTNLVMKYDNNAVLNTEKATKITRSAILDYVALHRDQLIKEMSEVVGLNSTRRILTPVIGGALLHLANRKGGDQGLTFIRNVYIGGSADAAFDLREKLIRNASTAHKMRREYIFAILVKAYKSFLQGTRPGVLRLTDGEPFPKMP